MKSKWKLYRAIYGYDGLEYVEGQTMDAERFQEALTDGTVFEWIIGTAIKLEDGNTIIRTELEGKKENLDLVLELVNHQSAAKQNRGDLKGGQT